MVIKVNGVAVLSGRDLPWLLALAVSWFVWVLYFVKVENDKLAECRAGLRSDCLRTEQIWNKDKPG